MPVSPPPPSTPNSLDATLLGILAEQPLRSVPPEHIARLLATGDDRGWQRQLPAIRNAAMRLARAGEIEILRKGKVIDPDMVKGVVRFRIKSQSGSGSPIGAQVQ